ncbi:MAG: ribonuclease D [Planctomycetota bacterium]
MSRPHAPDTKQRDPEPHAAYVRDDAELVQLCERIRAAGIVAVDAEFIRDRTYYPQLALLQVAVGDEARLIDPLADLDLAPIDALIADVGVRKILHAATQDLEIFFHRTGQLPANVFDTQMAAAMLGMGAQISYGGLIERTTGVVLKKGKAFTDWLRRPLDRKQEEYALDDVRYLGAAYDFLMNRLRELGREEWLEEELRCYQRAERYLPDPRMMYTRVRRFGTLKPRGLAVLRELADWREVEARRRDRPRRRIVTDEVLVEVARAAPTTEHEIGQQRGLHPQVIKRNSKAIAEAVRVGLAVPDTECPSLPRNKRLDGDEQLLVTFLDACLKAFCRNENLDPSVVTSSAELQNVAAAFLGSRLQPDQHALLTGWRGDLIGRHLIAFLEGRLSVRVDPTTRQLVVDLPQE